MKRAKAAALPAMPFASGGSVVSRRWQPGPLHWVTGGTHIAGAAAIAAQPALWPWAVGAMLGSHALNLAFVLSPATTAFGPVIATLPPAAAGRGEIALTFDDGPDPEVTPHVLDVLDAAGAHATFFCVGSRARAHPPLVREIVARGHAVENHSFGHALTFGFYGIGRMARDIGAAQQALTDITGVAPRYFRAPFGIRTPLTEPALARLGLECVAWSIRSLDSIDSNPMRVAARITRRLTPGSIVLLHDGAEVRVRRGKPSMLGALPLVLSRIREHNWRCVTLRAALSA